MTRLRAASLYLLPALGGIAAWLHACHASRMIRWCRDDRAETEPEIVG